MFLIYCEQTQEWLGEKDWHCPRQLGDSGIWFDFTGVTFFKTKEDAELKLVELKQVDIEVGQYSRYHIDEFYLEQRIVGHIKINKPAPVVKKRKKK